MRLFLVFLLLLILSLGCVQNPDFSVLNKTPPASFPDSNTPVSPPPEPSDQNRVVIVGDVVSVDYNLTVNGELVDSSTGKSPFVFEVGGGQAIAGFDQAVLGLRLGETRVFDVSPAQGYGEIDANKIQSLPPSVFADPESLQVGMTIQSSERAWQGVVKSIGRGTDGNISYIEIDFNHPLAGKTLHFEIKVVKIE